jgi:hypothetical protein
VITAKGDIVRLEPNSLNCQRLVLFIDGEVFWVHPDGLWGGADGDTDNNAEGSSAEGSAGAGAGAGTGASSDIPRSAEGRRDEVVSVDIGICAEKLLLARFGAYDFYAHIARTFFRGEHA